MIVAPAYKSKSIGVFGLGLSGLCAGRSLEAAGADVHAWDDDLPHRGASGLELDNLYESEMTGLDALVLTPGVPLTHPAPHPLARKAQRAGVPVIGDIEIFSKARESLPEHQLVAVTGTNGKSTTTALMTHVLKRCGRDVAAGGNIGIPVLGLDPLPSGGTYVFELSSFQIDLCHTLEADIAILLNLTADHLDRHGSMKGYVAAKRRMFAMQRSDQVAVIAQDDAHCREIARELGQKIVPVSAVEPARGGVWVIDGEVVDDLDGGAASVGNINNAPNLRGQHNMQNAAAVFAAARLLGLGSDEICRAFQDFPGLAHRLEVVGEQDGVIYVNDSKASNSDAALKALAVYENVYWIAGGRFKEASPDTLVAGLDHVQKAYFLGEAGDQFAACLGAHVAFERVDDVPTATARAANDAQKQGGGVVLLAPACASFDQYDNFEERGDHFRQTVVELLKAGDE